MAYDTHPPLYNVIMLLWVSVFGDSAISIRILPLLCSAAGVFWIGRVAGFLIGPQGGLLAAALLALSGASVFYAQEARSYSFIILLFLMLAESLLRYHQRCDAGSLTRFLVLSLLCAASHVYAFLFVLCLWGLLLLTAPTPRAALGIARGALVPPAVAAPFYFLIALMVLFTKEHQYLWRGMTESFTPREAAALLSFYLFGYGGVNASSAVHLLAAVLFIVGVAIGLRRSPAEPAGSCPTDFSPRWLGRLFGWSAGLGLAGSMAALTAPWWLSVERVQLFVGREKHPELVAALPRLLQRTGVLYVLAYAALVAFWLALGSPERPGPLGRLGPKASTPHRLLQPAQSLVALPLLAIVLVMVISQLRPTYNSRYMLALLPFGVITMAVALWRLATPRLRLALSALVLGSQAVSLAAQDDAYALLKPDYKSALAYASRLGRPVTGTALWELDNLSRYYARRGEIGPVTVLSRPQATRAADVVVFVPRAYPLDAPHLVELRGLVHARARRSVSFQGLTLYEVQAAGGPP
jgi:uncharacterized membrane protein